MGTPRPLTRTMPVASAERLSGRRIVALTAAAILASAACVALGLWQWQRTTSILEAEQAATSMPIPVEEVFVDGALPDGSIGRPVIARGEYAGTEPLLVAGRSAGGEGAQPGEWVLAPLDVGGITVVVLRGWIPVGASAALAVPAGPVEVTGVVQPFEEFYADLPVREDGRLVAISRSAIETAWGAPVAPAVLVLAAEVPAQQPAPIPVPPTVQTANVPFPLQNAAYTAQWFVFAAFVWLMWALWLRRGPRPGGDGGEAKDGSAASLEE